MQCLVLSYPSMCIVSHCVLSLAVACDSMCLVLSCVSLAFSLHVPQCVVSLNVSCLVLSCFVVAYLVTSLYFCLVACLRPSSLTSITNVSQFALFCFVLVSRSVPCRRFCFVLFCLGCLALSCFVLFCLALSLTLLLQSKGCVRERWSERERERQRERESIREREI